MKEVISLNGTRREILLDPERTNLSLVLSISGSKLTRFHIYLDGSVVFRSFIQGKDKSGADTYGDSFVTFFEQYRCNQGFPRDGLDRRNRRWSSIWFNRLDYPRILESQRLEHK